jgi:phage terminase large subunit
LLQILRLDARNLTPVSSLLDSLLPHCQQGFFNDGIQTAKVFRPLLEPARYRSVRLPRHRKKFFGELIVERCLMYPGSLAVCIREVQRSLVQSSKRLIETKIQELGVGSQFKVFHDRIETPGDGLIIFQGMQDSTAESIKSLERYRVAWTEEAQTLSHRSLQLLRPTIRAESFTALRRDLNRIATA